LDGAEPAGVVVDKGLAAAEVTKFAVVLGRDDDVGRLEVEVDHVMFMNVA